MTPVTDPGLLAQLNGSAPKPVTDPNLLAQLNAPSAGGFLNGAKDFVKSIPGGIASGMKGFADLSLMLTGADQDTTRDPIGEAAGKAFNSAAETLPKPEGTAGQYGRSVGEFAGNPISYAGAGTAALKAGGVVLGGLGSEAGGQLTKDTGYETAGRMAGGLAGGVAAVKTLGPKQATAAVQTVAEQKAAKNAGYQAARDANLVLKPEGPASWAAQVEQELTNGPKYGFTGGADGTAPKTLGILAKAGNPPEGATITGENLNTLRIQLNNIARETKDFLPTSDAIAAQTASRRFAKYVENIPEDHVLAGDAAAYGQLTKTANKDNAAYRRMQSFEQKLTNATDATEGSIAAKIDNQTKSKLRNGYLTNEKKQYGLTDSEVDAIRNVNRGSLTERALRQFGRLAPEGPANIALHLMAGTGPAMATGGVSVPIQIAGALAASAAKHGAQRMTRNNAQRVAEMLAMRSPEYEKRAAAIPQVDLAPNKAALIRALMLSH